MRVLKVFEDDSGEMLEEIKFSGGYNIQYATNEDSGNIHHIVKLDNAKFDEKHWIKNLIYRPVCQQIVERFEETTARHIILRRYGMETKSQC